MPTEPKKIRLALVDDHKMILGALTEWIRNVADDIQVVAAVSTWPARSTSYFSTSTSRTESLCP